MLQVFSLVGLCAKVETAPFDRLLSIIFRGHGLKRQDSEMGLGIAGYTLH